MASRMISLSSMTAILRFSMVLPPDERAGRDVVSVLISPITEVVRLPERRLLVSAKDLALRANAAAGKRPNATQSDSARQPRRTAAQRKRCDEPVRLRAGEQRRHCGRCAHQGGGAH